VKAAHLRKIAARLDRANTTLGDPVLVKRALRNILPHYEGLTLANRVNDILALINNDVPALIASDKAAKIERVRLLGIIRTLHAQLEGTITEPDAEIEHKEPGAGDMLKAMGYLD
jgi:hypothetical protein